MPKRGRSRKKNRTHVAADEGGGASSALDGGNGDHKVPKSLIMRRGKTALEIGELVHDMRRIMQPYTALNFTDSTDSKTTLQQYATSLALPMGISHILQFRQKEHRCNLRLARMPEGPTLSFRVERFSLTRHIQQLQKRPIAFTGSLTTKPPITVTNNFGDHTAAPHIKLLRITFQNLFPQVNVSTVKLKDCRRVVLFNLIESTDDANDQDESSATTTRGTRQLVEMRHYAIKATPVGVDRKVRRLVQAKLPNLHNVDDIADYLTGQSTAIQSDALSDSEPEDDPAYTVQLPDKYVGAGCNAKQKSALKLVELGPRLTLQLLKVEKGLDSNTPCLYNALVTKTPHEVKALQAKKETQTRTKEQRKAIQDANVERKRVEAEEKRAAKRQRLEQRQASAATTVTTAAAGSTAASSSLARGSSSLPLRDELQIEGLSSSDEEDNDDVESSHS
jgi:ribosome biogenesis protein SSF1/2